MARGVELTTSGRRWGRAGVVALVLLSACSSVAADPVTRASQSAVGASRSAASVHAPDHPSAFQDEALIAPPPMTFSGPVATSPPPAPLRGPNRATANGAGVWSVVIGINDYPGSDHDLEYARNDAADMDTALSDVGEPAAQRVDLVDGQASAATIRRSVDWLVANAGPDALAVFFYAGHVRKLSDGHVAIVGADGSLVTDQQLADHLAGLRAAHAWIVIAACYGGGFDAVLAPGRILTAAAGPDQLAYETTTYHRSYFDEYMIHRGMIEGLGGPTIQSAFAYASAALQQDHPDRMPVEYDRAGGPVAIGASPSSTAAPAAPPRPPPPPPRSQPTAMPTTTSTTAPGSRQQCLLRVGSTVRCGN